MVLAFYVRGLLAGPSLAGAQMTRAFANPQPVPAGAQSGGMAVRKPLLNGAPWARGIAPLPPSGWLCRRLGAQCHLLCQVRPSASLGGADALGGALWARRPPGRLLDDRRCLILRGKSGTRASRADQGVRPTINAESHLPGKVSDIGLGAGRRNRSGPPKRIETRGAAAMESMVWSASSSGCGLA